MYERIGVIGSGAMGRGIAQLFATAGKQIKLYDTRPEAVEQALNFNEKLLKRAVEKGKLSEADFQAIMQRMQMAARLEDMADCELVIEAIVEDLEAKQALFRSLEAILDSSAVLATNTSSLSVNQIASACERPQNVAGFHFFNPVPLMKIIEVVQAAHTDPAIIKNLCALAEHAGHFPAVTPDTPGFLVNHAGRAYGTEALRIQSEGIASIEQIDRILRDVAGFRMGPFELFDLTGLDVSHAVMESIFEQFYGDPRYTPSYLAAQRVAAGLLGRKSAGQGYYRYEDGKQIVPDESAPATVDIDRPFWLDTQDSTIRSVVSAILDKAGATLETGAEPSTQAICLITPFGVDASATIAQRRLPATRTIALDVFGSLEKRRVLMRHPALDPAIEAQARQALGGGGIPVEVINDSPGFIVQRIIASIVNLGCEIAQRGIATPATIDRAIQLALGYPQGPLAFGEKYGTATVLEILRGMQQCYDEPRYRPSPWLRRRVQLNLPLHHPDQSEGTH